MSARHQPVSWTRAKKVYDLVLVAGVLLYLAAFLDIGQRLRDPATALDAQSLAMKAYGSCAFILLTIALCIGPLARLDRRFLPLLYNRRHLGVVTFLVALSHALEVLGWHFDFSPTPRLVAMLSSEPAIGAAPGLPFVPMGLVALLILFVLAATSHDFWLGFLTPPMWKWLHMAIYPAYALVVAHVAFGQFQSATNPALALLVGGGALLVLGVHLAAGVKTWREDSAIAAPAPEPPWLLVGPAASVPDGRGMTIRPPQGEKIAIFRDGNRISAVTNLCAHQNGPLGEGRVIDGCITCPWHGFQYRLEDGCAPPPFTEKLATYNLRLAGDALWLDPRPNPPGTPVVPVILT
jgi:nitrite reductase/ring-hydroxylating ferredoxin subunit/DMSO/TMAO reductase YedYZ heme-binding membrane subunit